jgi:cation transport regulator ChaB
MPASKEMPSTIRRSGAKAKRTWSKAHDSAVDEYGEGERAHRTAFAALKHTHEKSGDKWVPKPGGRKGPSDEQAAKSGRAARRSRTDTKGGVDEKGRTKESLYARAKQLAVRGRSKMSKSELAEAIDKANRKATRKARPR